MVWNTYDLDHPWGLGTGLLADWRPFRDGRLRMAAHLKSTPDFRLNWSEGFLRTDWMIGHASSAAVIAGLGYRFQTSFRNEAYWRPRVQGRFQTGIYAHPKVRVSLTSTVQWLPLQDGLEGGLSLHFQASPRRGLRDFSPLSFPFNAALDSRVEAQ